MDVSADLAAELPLRGQTDSSRDTRIAGLEEFFPKSTKNNQEE
jgi:hypothetical protein